MGFQMNIYQCLLKNESKDKDAFDPLNSKYWIK